MGVEPRIPPPDRRLADLLHRHIAERGPIGFDEYVAHALYAPALGFYSRGGGAGRRRDFITSPEVGPLFGAVLARALDRWWDELGRPSTYRLLDVGAGPGTLARAVMAARPRCSDALSIQLVEQGEVQWTSHPAGVESRAELPAAEEVRDGALVVVANELLDNLPFGLAELGDEGWQEVVVDVAPSSGDASAPKAVTPELVERLRPLPSEQAGWCVAAAGPEVSSGARIPVQAEAADWLRTVLELAEHAEAGGRVVVFDYASTTPEMAGRPSTEWVRTYAAHGRAGDPLHLPGTRDITCEVAVDQLELVRATTLDRTQAAFLADHGIEELVEEGRRRWEAEGFGGGLGAVAARSRGTEAAALTDPDGLGAFRALEWAVRPAHG